MALKKSEIPVLPESESDGLFETFEKVIDKKLLNDWPKVVNGKLNHVVVTLEELENAAETKLAAYHVATITDIYEKTGWTVEFIPSPPASQSILLFN